MVRLDAKPDAGDGDEVNLSQLPRIQGADTEHGKFNRQSFSID